MADRVRLEFMKNNPVLRVLDKDGDGQISFREIDSSSVALRGLDTNGDGSLSPAEVLPERVDRRTAMILSRLDKNLDGRLSRKERDDEEADHLRGLLDHANRNSDEFVTAAEAPRELQLRDDTKRIEERARRAGGQQK